jgi:hypothetical protein
MSTLEFWFHQLNPWVNELFMFTSVWLNSIKGDLFVNAGLLASLAGDFIWENFTSIWENEFWERKSLT